MPDPTLVLDDLVFPEGLRWHAGRLWLSDILDAHRILTDRSQRPVDAVADLADVPSGLGFLPVVTCSWR